MASARAARSRDHVTCGGGGVSRNGVRSRRHVTCGRGGVRGRGVCPRRHVTCGVGSVCRRGVSSRRHVTCGRCGVRRCGVRRCGVRRGEALVVKNGRSKPSSDSRLLPPAWWASPAGEDLGVAATPAVPGLPPSDSPSAPSTPLYRARCRPGVRSEEACCVQDMCSWCCPCALSAKRYGRGSGAPRRGAVLHGSTRPTVDAVDRVPACVRGELNPPMQLECGQCWPHHAGRPRAMRSARSAATISSRSLCANSAFARTRATHALHLRLSLSAF
jgi:hypothetical protein